MVDAAGQLRARVLITPSGDIDPRRPSHARAAVLDGEILVRDAPFLDPVYPIFENARIGRLEAHDDPRPLALLDWAAIIVGTGHANENVVVLYPVQHPRPGGVLGRELLKRGVLVDEAPICR